MANYYCEGSGVLELPKDKIEQAKEIIARVSEELEEEDGFLGVDIVFEEEGIWFSHDESLTPSHVERIASCLLDELEIDEPFYFTWAETCSKPRVDSFSGGGFAVKRGHDSHRVHASSVRDHVFES
jgi:hypothetical protein